jgi:hypothetical protein
MGVGGSEREDVVLERGTRVASVSGSERPWERFFFTQGEREGKRVGGNEREM